MTDVTFDRLISLPLREAWKHEAREFTPWLGENIDHLSDAIGIPLELTGQEVRVESFAADILARNPSDDSVVLIENQLEQTDHTHLGQIMTYLAGLEAQTVVWIAPEFRQPHLSAIRWLNENTADGFSFFAVKARIVRIGDSPFAPIFEVVEKPNDWERQLSGQRKSAQRGNSEIGGKREAYWRAFSARHPDSRVTVGRGGWVSFAPDVTKIAKVVLWIGQTEGGIFVRNHSAIGNEDFMARVQPHFVDLEGRLGIENKIANGTILGQRWNASVNDPTTWPDIQDWQERELERYIFALDEILGDMA